MPGIVIAPGGGGGGGGGDIAAVLPGLELGNPFVFLVPMWTMYMSGSYHVISQAGWNRCINLYSTPRHAALPDCFSLSSPALYRTAAIFNCKGAISLSLSLSQLSTLYSRDERERGESTNRSSHTGLMQMLPGHLLADPRSRSSGTQHSNPQKLERHQ